MTRYETLLRRHDGFTLVELSIVLTVIALVAGGVVLGRELIQAAALRRVVSDFNRYNVAVQTFKNKYGQLPGDIPNATAYWGPAGGNVSDNYTATCQAVSAGTPVGGTATCNGDGDGLISGRLSTGGTCTGLQFWQVVQNCGSDQFGTWHHLANAGLIEGVYVTARSGSTTLDFRPRWVRGPGGNLAYTGSGGSDGFHLIYLCRVTDLLLSGMCSHAFIYGRQSPAVNNNYQDFPTRAALTPAAALSIDAKLDDGLPGKGSIGAAGTGASCATSTNPNIARYDAVTTDVDCALIMKASF